MAENTKIQWATHTFNPWRGCTKVSEGCLHCYAETLVVKRWKQDTWGPGKPRLPASEAMWRAPLVWNRAAARVGQRHRVFCASLADVFDAEAPPGALARLWGVIKATPHLDWLLLTKRADRIRASLPEDWGLHGYGNVWLGVSAENQRRAEERIPRLLGVPARCSFVSYEPALGPLDLWRAWVDGSDLAATVSWVIIGGESGPGARPFHLDWARGVLQQVHEAESRGGTFAPFVKQLGAHLHAGPRRVGRTTCYAPRGSACPTGGWRPPILKDRKGGDPAEWPTGLRVRAFPPTCAACARALPGPDYDYCPSCEEPEQEPVPLPVVR